MAENEVTQEEGVLANVKGDTSYTPEFSIKEMLEAGVHFGHRTARWNAKMIPYIYGIKNELHILDLQQTAILLAESVKILRELVKRRGKILFVCTKKQGADMVAKMAQETGQYYVTNKWLGGMLTNWKTISRAIKTLSEIERELGDELSPLTKKEKLGLEKRRQKLIFQLGGIRDMTKLPDLLFVIDTPKENLAITEAKALGIPVMAIVDTNSDPTVINFPIPGNDDSIKALELYVRVIGDALMDVKDFVDTNESSKKDDFKKVSKKPSKSFGKKERLPVKISEGELAIKEENLPSITESKE
ncbi:MAG: 30S ribosomal protein S2 [Rickettsiales bacterium]|nr:30S ribosomal protein S2 [Rickettsiales bacterium]